MVFAPKKESQSIGWESRKPNKSGSKKKSKRASPNSIEASPKSKKRLKENLDIENVVKCSDVDVEHKQSSSVNENLEASLIGPQLPPALQNVLGDDQQVDAVEIENDTIPSSIEKEVVIENGIVSNVVTFTNNEGLQSIAINGSAKAQVLEGSFDIMGFSATDTCEQKLIIDSPTWMSAISINARNVGISKIRITSMKNGEPTFELSSTLETKSIMISEKWETIGSNISECKKACKRILVCGGKGVGKSTMVRYLVNRLLSQEGMKKIALLDCDAGQPEFSAPGILSLTIVTKPILSPPHSHIICGREDKYTIECKHELASFYGYTTSKINPVRYIESVRSLLQRYEAICSEMGEKIPLVINTDGWVKGMGYEILSSVIDSVNPDHIVQIIGSTKAKFFDLTPHSSNDRTIHVTETASGKMFDPNIPSPAISRNASLASLDSIPESAATSLWQIESLAPMASSLTRNLRFCTYFLGGYDSFLKTGATFGTGGISDESYAIALNLASLKPFVVPFDALDTFNLDENGEENIIGEEEYHDILNGSIIGLCGDSVSGIRECYGYGLVRSIDIAYRFLYIITPIQQSVLQANVTSIISCQMQLPPEALFCGEFSESFPHISFEGSSMGIGSEVMKSKSVMKK
ncbi:hypothetical protein CTEN210_17256 [Chaetoceros tenuissimus]|uniref:Uncharacterized protein n=1 Tax=Chaetoceros tenuissimus TaxID=426638 RepID=A0AAD3DCF1_9STRA|nr:hypothetical protein CTEN210_17256 [Chaetoceros tenuissimus]